MRPVFESVEYGELDKLTCLVRPSPFLPVKLQAAGEIQSTSNVVVPDTSGVRVLCPGASSMDKVASGVKRKTTSSDKGDSLAMVDRYEIYDTYQSVVKASWMNSLP